MTELAFHFNVAEKIGYACRLLRKAQRSGAKVVVTAEPALLQQLDQALWTFSPLEFISHCSADASPQMAQASAVLLTHDAAQAPHTQVLVNLGVEVPHGFERFERLIELVGAGDADRHSGRLRWRHYAQRGYAMTRHDVAVKEAGGE